MGESARGIFLSYTSQDADSVRRLCEALRAAGLEVWFDQNELRGGEAWDASIRRQILDCALFVPVVSAHTEARGEGYFRLEWRLAVERSQLMADDQAFLFPVVIDNTNEATARVPDRFRERQWARLVGGECTPAFIEQIQRLLAAASTGQPFGAAPQPKNATGVPSTSARKRQPWLAAALAAAVAGAALIAGLAARSGHVAASVHPASAAPTAATPMPPDRKSIAVLPFENLTGHPEDAYLADGLQEEILNALARIRDLNVISRTSTAEFRGQTSNVREVGNRLGVGSVLEGSVRREGQKVRLTVQLIDARTDRHILAADYDRDLAHLLGLQSEVARKVADALAAILSKYEHGDFERVATNNGDAYNLYLRAVALWRRDNSKDDAGVADSRPLLEQAVRLDPDYADALALLSQACTGMYFDKENEADARCAKENYERVLALDPQLPEARLARGVYELYVAKDLERAIADLQDVAQLRPNSAEAHFALAAALRRAGRLNEAIVHFSRAWDLDPLNPYYSGQTEVTLLGLRRYPEMVDQIKLAQRRFPADAGNYFEIAQIQCRIQHSLEPLRLALREHGDTLPKEDRTATEAGIARDEGRYLDAINLLQSIPDKDPVRNLQLGFLYWAAGKGAEAERSFRALKREMTVGLQKSDDYKYNFRENLALAQSMLGEHATALATIEILRSQVAASHDFLFIPHVAFLRSIILVRAGRSAEGYAEVTRLLHVPFGAPFKLQIEETLLAVKNDPKFDELVNRPPRL